MLRIIMMIIDVVYALKGDNMDKTNQTIARVFKAMGDENRLTILTLLHTGERCACRLQEALDISQPTLSHHMRILLDANLVNARKDGKWIYYSLSEAGAQQAREMLISVLNMK